MIKKAGYLLFAVFYYLCRLFPRDRKKIFLVATHDDSPEGNIGIVAEAVRQREEGYRLVWFTRKDRITDPINFFIRKAYHLATASYVFLDNEFLPMAYLHFPESVKVVQLWHGTGTIKKFGQDVNTGTLGRLEYCANQNITHLIVNSEEVKAEYASAFGVSEDRIYPIGLPRTDLLLNPDFLEDKRGQFLDQYPQVQKKRCILYAPTFRDSEVDSPEIHLDLQEMSDKMSSEDVLLIRLHPHVAQKISWEEKRWKNIINVSEYPGVTTLLAVADVLITDYSSIVFEYCLRNKPMIFYAYDLEQFEKNGRSFYRDYRSFVPGRVVQSTEELLDCLKAAEENKAAVFTELMFDKLDGKATLRLLELIF